MPETQYDLERLEELIAAGQTLPKLDVPATVLPGGAEVHTLEPYLAEPLAQRVTFRTERLQDFLTYASAEGQDETAVFIAPDGSGARAVIDFGNHNEPRWGHHNAQLTMRHTPEFAALKAMTGKLLSQRDLTDWLEDWTHVVTVRQDGQDLQLPLALQLIRRIDIKAARNTTHEQGDFTASRSAFEEIEAKAANGQPPSEFVLAGRVYPETAQRHITARLSLLTGDDEPRFRLRILGEDALHEEVAREIEDYIRQDLGDVKDGGGTRIYVGQVDQ